MYNDDKEGGGCRVGVLLAKAAGWRCLTSTEDDWDYSLDARWRALIAHVLFFLMAPAARRWQGQGARQGGPGMPYARFGGVGEDGGNESRALGVGGGGVWGWQGVFRPGTTFKFAQAW